MTRALLMLLLALLLRATDACHARPLSRWSGARAALLALRIIVPAFIFPPATR